MSTVGAAIGGDSSSGINAGRIFISLKPCNERKAPEAQIIQRLHPELTQVPGITTFMQPLETIHIRGRLSRTEYQYTLQDVDMAELQEWVPKLEAKLKNLAGLQDVASDLEHMSPIDDPHQLRPRLPPPRRYSQRYRKHALRRLSGSYVTEIYPRSTPITW